MTHRTIIDILRKGNQELFHSSIIAWLLDPRAEHGYGPAFLDAFARLVEDKGDPRFRAALQGPSVVKITTETTGKKSRYDIRLEIGGTAVVIENKTKSLGDDPQFEQYKGENTVLVALGLCDMSFSEMVKGKYPLVTYANLLAILDGLPDPPGSDFKVLVNHYRQFLRRELAVLAGIDHQSMSEPGSNSIVRRNPMYWNAPTAGVTTSGRDRDSLAPSPLRRETHRIHRSRRTRPSPRKLSTTLPWLPTQRPVGIVVKAGIDFFVHWQVAGDSVVHNHLLTNNLHSSIPSWASEFGG